MRHINSLLLASLLLCFGSSPVSADSDAEALAAVQRLMETGGYAQAYDAATQFLHDYPESALRLEAQFRQGLCVFQLGRWAAAKDVFQRLRMRRDISPPIEEALPFYLAEIAYREGRYAEATSQYQAVIAAPRSSQYKPSAQVGLGWAYYQQGRCAESFAALDSLRKSGAGAIAGSTLFALGDCAQRLGRLDDAMQALRQLLSQDPQNTWADDAALRLGELLVTQGRDAEARMLFDERLATHPAGVLTAAFHVQAGQLALKAGDANAAHAHFEYAATHAEQSPFFISALTGLGDVAFERATFDEAARHYARAVLASPHGPYAAYALFQQAQALLNAGSLAKARYLYQQLLETMPECRFIEEAMFRLGQAWDAEGRTTQAIEQYGRLLSRAPQSAWSQRAQLAWAGALSRTGHRDAAGAMLQQLIERVDLPEVRALATVQYAQALAGEGRPAEASTLLQELLRGSPPSSARAEAELALARWAIDARHWAEAGEHLVAASRLPLARDTDAECLFLHGWVALQQHQLTEASDLWDSLIARHPQHARAGESRPWRLLAAVTSQGIVAALAVLDRWRSGLSADVWGQVGRECAERLREEGLADEAIRVLTYLLPQLPEPVRPQGWCLLGEIYEEEHRNALAVNAYQQAARSVPPWSMRGALAAARLLEAGGAVRDAARLYRQVSAGSSPEAAVAAERLEQLNSHQ